MQEETKYQVGLNAKRVIEERNLVRTKLAAKIGCSDDVITRITSGKNVYQQWLYGMAQALEMPFEELSILHLLMPMGEKERALINAIVLNKMPVKGWLPDGCYRFGDMKFQITSL